MIRSQVARLSAGLVALACLLQAAPKAEILWDKYGVPHIFADSVESMFYAHGWAQMQNHADLLLRLYGESRGRASEYWGGEANQRLDRWVRTNGVPELAQKWYQAQDPNFRRNLDAFARGINDFAKARPNHTSQQFRVVLPVTGVDVTGHSLRAVHFMYMGSQNRMRTEVGRLLPKATASLMTPDLPSSLVEPLADAGSNTWAVGPSRSASGKPMLIINPHLIWEDFYTYMEVHLTAPGYDLYGAPQIGFPVPVIGFNRDTGWGRTVNTLDTVDFYRLKVREGKYEWDGTLKDFERETRSMRVKQPDGTLREEKWEVRRSVHGPVVFDEQGVTVAMRVAGLDRPKMLEQWFRMGGARNLGEFQDAMRMVAVPMWHANYAGSDGHLMLLFNGVIPKRGTGDWNYWSQVVPGDTSKTLWTSYHTFEELPKSIDPPSGFNQNANEPPWYFTVPQLDPKLFPPYIAPGPERLTSMRTTRSLRMISEDKSITYDELLAYKHSTRMELADAVVPELVEAAEKSNDPLVREAGAVLKAWDRMAEVDSKGGVLFELFADRGLGGGDGLGDVFRIKYDYRRPLETARGLANPASALAALKSAAEECKQRYGSLSVPWGEVHRFQRGNLDIPANGASGRLGVFRTMQFATRKNNKLYASHGETFVCAIEFTKPQKAQCLLGYGNATQPGSKHIEDQLPLMQQKKLHPVWRERSEIEANLESRETLRP
jgi:acyl-homoserine-lactone acylase